MSDNSNNTAKIAQLEIYADAHYRDGGHWVVECFGSDDYQGVLDQVGGDMDAAKAVLKRHWELMVEQESNCAW